MRPRITRTLTALGILTSLLVATAAQADPALQAKQLKVDMVTAYNQCTAPILTHRPTLAFPACVPARTSANNPANIYEFGPKGKMSVQLQRTTGDIKLKIKGAVILRNGTPYSGAGLTGSVVVRATDNGCGAAFDVDCTMVDFPFPVGLSCTNGKCSASSSTANLVLPGTLHAGDTANIELQQIQILDDDGDVAFRMGLLVP